MKKTAIRFPSGNLLLNVYDLNSDFGGLRCAVLTSYVLWPPPAKPPLLRKRFEWALVVSED